MKTFFACSLVAALAAGSLPAAPSLTVGNAPGYPGITTVVPVNLGQASNVVVAQFDCAFHTGKVAQATAALAPPAPGQRVKSRELGSGLRRVLAYSLTPGARPSTNRHVANLPFTLAAREYVGSGPLTPTNAILVQRDETQLTGVTFQPGTVFARPVNLRPDGTADFFIRSMPTTNYWIQASPNLVQWTTLSTNRATSDYLESSDPNSRFFDYRFYRAQPLP